MGTSLLCPVVGPPASSGPLLPGCDRMKPVLSAVPSYAVIARGRVTPCHVHRTSLLTAHNSTAWQFTVVLTDLKSTTIYLTEARTDFLLMFFLLFLLCNEESNSRHFLTLRTLLYPLLTFIFFFDWSKSLHYLLPVTFFLLARHFWHLNYIYLLRYKWDPAAWKWFVFDIVMSFICFINTSRRPSF